jgi:phage gp36-like protein
MFASRLDLLARSNAQRLAQLAVPTDREMVVDEAALRIAINGGSLTGYSDADVATINLALVAIDNALADADALLISYGIPDTVQTSLLARLASTVALYYLQGAERMTESLQVAYDNVIKQLNSHAKGDISLIPAVVTTPPQEMGLGAEIFSGRSRYSNDDYYGDC